VNRNTYSGEPVYQIFKLIVNRKAHCGRLASITMKSKTVSRPKQTQPQDHSNQPITLKTLSAHLGLSRTTLSMILNDVPDAKRFPEETRRRVLEFAKEIGYRPNYFARSLGKKRSHLIGVIAPDLGDGYEAALLGGFERRLLDTGYTSLVSNHFWFPGLLERHIETLCDRGVEALLLIDSTPAEYPGVPAVMICTSRSPIWCTRVSIDNALGIRQTLHHLSGIGHKKIAFFKGPQQGGDTNDRWNAVLATCQKLGIRVDPRLTVQLERLDPTVMRRPEEGRIATQKLLERGVHFTALVAYNDMSALGAMSVLREAGYLVPEDVSVMGFDDIEFAGIAFPPLTTVRQPLREMGATAAEVLIRKIENNETVANISVHPEFILRSSTCPLEGSLSKGAKKRIPKNMPPGQRTRS
jgi:DNA-binding LacI/PurR family transcriptional regulator